MNLTRRRKERRAEVTAVMRSRVLAKEEIGRQDAQMYCGTS